MVDLEKLTRSVSESRIVIDSILPLSRDTIIDLAHLAHIRWRLREIPDRRSIEYFLFQPPVRTIRIELFAKAPGAPRLDRCANFPRMSFESSEHDMHVIGSAIHLIEMPSSKAACLFDLLVDQTPLRRIEVAHSFRQRFFAELLQVFYRGVAIHACRAPIRVGHLVARFRRLPR